MRGGGAGRAGSGDGPLQGGCQLYVDPQIVRTGLVKCVAGVEAGGRLVAIEIRVFIPNRFFPSKLGGGKMVRVKAAQREPACFGFFSRHPAIFG